MPPTLDLDFVLIPAGEFGMGSSRSAYRQAGTDELLPHRLQVTDYYIMRYPVTNAQYRLFAAATGHRAPLYWPQGEPRPD